MNFMQSDENIAYHAFRLLLLINYCGKPQQVTSDTLPGIEGRTLLAKLDFFLRYPAYLRKAAKILEKQFSDEELGLVNDAEEKSVESRMVRYLYGPWDHIYYLTLAYLIGKELIEIEKKKGRDTEVFRLTGKGQNAVKLILKEDSSYTDLAKRADTVYHTFNGYTGNSLKEFIYEHFPDIVSRKIGTII